VKDARVSYEKGTAWVEYDDGKVTVARLIEVIDGTGFKAAGVVSGGRGPSRHMKRRSKL
jgi:copper chaperone CopZ